MSLLDWLALLLYLGILVVVYRGWTFGTDTLMARSFEAYKNQEAKKKGK
ncbi:hypothetical protein SEA_KEELAN_21 [Gordonia phage Keelan]|nr:hypothetical protein SEA_KEELAN_21 [Gordonia phage Keelan]